MLLNHCLHDLEGFGSVWLELELVYMSFVCNKGVRGVNPGPFRHVQMPHSTCPKSLCPEAQIWILPEGFSTCRNAQLDMLCRLPAKHILLKRA